MFKQAVNFSNDILKFRKILHVNKEKVTFFFTFMIGVIYIIGGFRYGIGVLTNLDRGAFPIFIGMLVCIISIFLFFSISFHETEENKKNQVNNSKKILILLLSLAVYVLLLDWVGFPVLTFLFLFFLQKLMGQSGWWVPLVISIVTVIVFWILFKIWLNVQLPVGLIKL